MKNTLTLAVALALVSQVLAQSPGQQAEALYQKRTRRRESRRSRRR
jgi:hypothetical protein